MAVGLVLALDDEEEVGKVAPVGTGGDVVGTDFIVGEAAVAVGVLARMGHDVHPDVVFLSPGLEEGQHALDALGLALVFLRGLELDEEVGVDDEVVEPALPAVLVGEFEDVLGGALFALEIEMGHVLVEKLDAFGHHFFGAEAEVGRLAVEFYHVGVVLGFVGGLEGEEEDVHVLAGHEVHHEVVEEVALSAVGLAGHDDEPAGVVGMKHVVGEGSVA